MGGNTCVIFFDIKSIDYDFDHSLDGYSQPQDVGWYQVQSRQKNTDVFV